MSDGRFPSVSVSRMLARGLARDHVTVFCMHRFGPTESWVGSAGLDELDRRLDFLARAGVRFLELGDVVECIASGQPLRRITKGHAGVVFTVDDGYRDVRDGAAVFQRHGCPFTLFVCTDFVDRRRWLWWDKVEFLLRAQAGGGAVRVGPGEDPVTWASDGEARREAYELICRIIKTLPADAIDAVPAAIAEQLGVDLPEESPEMFRPASWEELAELGAGGIASFGPHTLSHPILARCGDTRSRDEIVGSSRRVSDQLDRVVPVLAYPNGDRASFGQREIAAARAVSLQAAVTTEPGYVSQLWIDREVAMEIPRFPYPEERRRFLHAALGIQRIKRVLRRLRGREG